MTLQYKITRAGHYSLIIKEEVEAIEKIAENFAIDFHEWRSITFIKNIDQYTNKEAMKIFKIERNL
jgi:hypothetical protein